MMFRNVSLLAIVVAIGLLLFLVHIFRSKGHNQKSSGSGHFGWILLFLAGFALAFLVAARSGLALPLRGLHLGLPGALEILVLVFIVLLLAAVFYKKEGRGLRVGIFVLFSMVLLLLAGFFMFSEVQLVRTSPRQEYDIGYQYQIPDVSKTPAIWSDGVEERYSADIYPSKVSAVRALGYEVVAQIQKMRPHIIKEPASESALAGLIEDERSWKLISGMGAALRNTIVEKKANIEVGELVANIPVDRLVSLAMQPAGQESNNLVIKLVQDEHERNLMEELREVIVDGIDDCRCEIVSWSSEVDTEREEIGVSLEIESKKSSAPIIIEKTKNYTMIIEGTHNLETRSDTGKIEARIFSSNYDRRAIEVRFAEKPWVENFADYLNRHAEPQRQWIRARSSETCFSVEEAHRLSLQDAAERVGGLLKGFKERILPEDLVDSGMIADQFSQSFEGSEGMVWRQALLVDVSKPKLEQLIYKKNVASSMQRRSYMFLGVSFLGMMGIICVLYALANAATKGYYRSVLRFFVVFIIIAAVIGLMAFAS